jgi:branched-chain amino acid transport system substrate-binding protein
MEVIMISTRKILVVVACVLLFLIQITSCNPRGKEVFTDIGVVVPLSGNSSNYGESARRGIDLAIKEINNSGGAAGRKLRPTYEDSKANARDGVNAIQKLISANKVQVIVGDIVSGVTLAAAPICESNKVVLISPTSTAPAITNAGQYIFRNISSDNLEGKLMADFMRGRGINKVAILQVQNDYGEGISGVFTEQFKRQGGQVVLHERYKQDESDFRSLLAKVSSSSPEALYCIGYYTDVGFIAKQAREQGDKLALYATTTIEDPQFLKVAGTAAEGVIYPLASGFSVDSNDSSITKFIASYENEYKQKPGFVEAQAYDCVYLIRQAIENGGGITGPEIQRGMAQIKGFRGATGETSFDQNGDVEKQLVMKTVREGRFVPLTNSTASQKQNP